MSTTTITAEGGTIKLTTAESGEVTAVSSDFSVTVVQQVVVSGAVIVDLPSFSDLYVQATYTIDTTQPNVETANLVSLDSTYATS